MNKQKRNFIFSDRLAAAFVMLPDEKKIDAIGHIISYGLGRCSASEDGFFEELEKIIDRDNNPTIKVSPEDVSYIIGYLNHKCDTKYRTSSQTTKKLINARYNDGFSREDFIKVIDLKSREWKGTKFERYLCPETLFGTKFEKYLNGKPGDETFTESSFNTNDFFAVASSRVYGDEL